MRRYLSLLPAAVWLFSLIGCHEGNPRASVDSFNIEITLQSDLGIDISELHYYLLEYPTNVDLEEIRAIYPDLGPAAELVTLPTLSADFDQAYTGQPDNNTLSFDSLPITDYVLWVEGNTVPTQRFLIRSVVENPVVRVRSGQIIEGLNLNSDTTLTLDIYEVRDEIIIGDGVTLNIAEGTELRFAPAVGITVNGGSLHISSSAGQPVLFLGRDEITGEPAEWDGIRLVDPLEPFLLDRALLMHADTALAFEDGGNITLSHSIFVDNNCALHGEGDFTLTNLRFAYNHNAITIASGSVSLSSSILMLQSENAVQTGPDCELLLEDNWFEACFRVLELQTSSRGVVTHNVFSGSVRETIRLDTPDSLDISKNTFHGTEELDIHITFHDPHRALYIQENNLLRGDVLNPIITVISFEQETLPLDLQYNYWNTTDDELIDSHVLVSTGYVEPDILPLAPSLKTDAGPGGNYPYGIQ